MAAALHTLSNMCSAPGSLSVVAFGCVDSYWYHWRCPAKHIQCANLGTYQPAHLHTATKNSRPCFRTLQVGIIGCHALQRCHVQTFCVPQGITLGCGAFVGATYQNCGSRYAKAQALAIAASAADGNYTTPTRAQSTANFRPLLAVLLNDFNTTMFAGAKQPACTTALSCVCNVSIQLFAQRMARLLTRKQSAELHP